MPSSDSLAVVFMPARSEPVPGSVMAMAVIMSPETKEGSQRRFCSSLPYLRMYGRHSAVCTLQPPKLTPARAHSSVITALNLKLVSPAPPYSSGTSMPKTPSSPSFL